MKKVTRKDIGDFLSANMETRTIKAICLEGTEFEDQELTEDWLVVFIGQDRTGVVTIECVPAEYFRRA